jgi:hypothetical protein
MVTVLADIAEFERGLILQRMVAGPAPWPKANGSAASRR